jgi:hypothetical protein
MFRKQLRRARVACGLCLCVLVAIAGGGRTADAATILIESGAASWATNDLFGLEFETYALHADTVDPMGRYKIITLGLDAGWWGGEPERPGLAVTSVGVPADGVDQEAVTAPGVVPEPSMFVLLTIGVALGVAHRLSPRRPARRCP